MVKNNDVGGVSLLSDLGLIGKIAAISDNFPAILGFLKKHQITSGTLFVPQTLVLVDTEISRNPKFLYEGYELLDAIALFEANEGRSSVDYLKRLIAEITFSRTVDDFELTLNAEAVTNLVFSNKHDVESLLLSNKVLLAVYILATVNLILYK